MGVIIMKARFTFLIALLVFASCSHTSKPDDPGNGTDPTSGTETELRPGLCGLGEPLMSTHLKAYNASGTYTDIANYSSRSLALIAAIHPRTYRMWFDTGTTYGGWKWNEVQMTKEADFSNFGVGIKARTHQILGALKSNGVEEITAVVGCLPRVPSTAVNTAKNYVPKPDSDEYKTFMQYVEWMYKALAKEYSEVDVWEVGNETNYGAIKYIDNDNLDYNTLARIMSDMFYAARKGVKAGNPDAKTITSGFAPISSYKLAADETIGTKSKTVLRKYGIESTADFMELIYKYIETGRFPSYLENKSTDPDDYFDGVTIHAYDLGSSLVIAESRHPDDWYNSEPINTNDPDSTAFTTFHWLKAIETVYEVMQEHTDSEKKIWITEFGVTTHTKHLTQSAEPPVGHPYAMRMQLGSSNYAWYYTTDEYERQHAWIAEEYMKALNTLECVHTCHFFRLHSPNADTSWSGGTTATMFGIFAEPDETLDRGIKPRPIAYAVQKLYKGEGDIEQFATWNSIK